MDKFLGGVVAVLEREAPGELEAWLRQTLVGACGSSTFEGLDPRYKKLWTDFIDEQMKVESPFTERLLTLICQSRAKEIGTFFSGNPRLFRDFFFQNKERISKWFQHFSFKSPALYGAKALEQYLFKHRDSLWDKLVWTGKRANPPNVVLKKLYLMMELDVYKAVCDVLCADDAFWESADFRDSLEDGSFISVDYPFFEKALFRMLNGKCPEKERLSDVIHSYVLTTPLREIVSEFVIAMSKHRKETLLDFVRCLGACLGNLKQWNPKASKATLATYLIGKAGFTKVDDLLCANALLTQSCQIRKTLDSDTNDGPKLVDSIEPSGCCCTRTDMRSYSLKGSDLVDRVMFTATKSFMWYSVILDITKEPKTKKAVKKLSALLSKTDYEPREIDDAGLYLEEGIPKKKRKTAHSHKSKHHKHKKDDWANEMEMMFGGIDEVNFEATKFAWEIKLHGSKTKFSLIDAADILQQKFVEECCEELELL